ncbi:hypothetical protein N665_0113s0001 [Sinapis alba]|nr:hypothetical protein N665_0113s0001 [Sinapis alba]
MKRARVNSVYEERKRSRKGDEIRRDHSKHARMTAKARMNIHKDSMKSLPKHKKSMMIKSMRSKSSVQDNQNNVIVRVVEKEKEKTKNDDGAIVTMEGKMKMSFSECLEEWPHTLTYEEEWIWFAFAFGWGWWWRYDAVMSGDNWFN